MINPTRLPEGVQDFLPRECMQKRHIEQKLRQTLSLFGYDEVETPILEFCDPLTSDDANAGSGGLMTEQLYKLIDRSGRVLAIRPEFTIPIARLAAGKLLGEALPLRLCALGETLEYPESDARTLHQRTQVDVEILGAEGPQADAEVISLAIQCLRDAGLHSFQIDIGQVGFFKGLIADMGVGDADAESIRQCIEEKNNFALELILSKLSLSQDNRARILSLPGLYGDTGVLTEAEALCCGHKSRAALDNMREVIAFLRDDGVERYISVDVGMVHSVNYYTGIIFRGITGHLGYPLLSGGRYDNLSARMGRSLPATGFAADVKSILIALERQGETFKTPVIDIALTYVPEARAAAAARAFALRDTGLRVEVSPAGTPAESFIARAQARGASSALIMRADGKTEVLWEGSDDDE